MSHQINKYTFIVLFTVFSYASLFAQSNNDLNGLNKIINTFKSAIINNSKEIDFYNLFLHESITWDTILEGKTKEKLQSKGKQKPFGTSSFKDFYRFVSTNNCKENFYNINMSYDNNYANVSFDYSFLRDDKIQNWGKEYWTLLKVEGQWKITSVIWTTNYQNIEKCPFVDRSYYKQELIVRSNES